MIRLITLLFALGLATLQGPLALAGEEFIGPKQVHFLGWSTNERLAAFSVRLSAGHSPYGLTPYQIVTLVDTRTQNVVATFKLTGPKTPTASKIPDAYRSARPLQMWQAIAAKGHFSATSYGFEGSTVRLRPGAGTLLHVRSARNSLVYGGEAGQPLNFEAVARLMDGSEQSLGLFLQPASANNTLHGAMALYRSVTGRHVLVLVDIWDAQGHLVDRDVRMVALTSAPLGYNEIGVTRAYGEIARGIRQIFYTSHPRARAAWDANVGALF